MLALSESVRYLTIKGTSKNSRFASRRSAACLPHFITIWHYLKKFISYVSIKCRFKFFYPCLAWKLKFIEALKRYTFMGVNAAVLHLPPLSGV